nr:hypothetical protein [Ruminococcus sp.]
MDIIRPNEIVGDGVLDVPLLIFVQWNAEGGGQIVKSSATKNTIRRKEVETKARTRVDDINDFIKLLIGKSSEIKALW